MDAMHWAYLIIGIVFLAISAHGKKGSCEVNDGEWAQREVERLEAEVERLQKTDAWEEVARQGIEIAALEDEVERLRAALAEAKRGP